MSPWTETRRPRWPIYTGLAVIIIGFVAGYLLMTGVVGDDDGGGGSDAAQTPGPVATDAPGQTGEPVLKVVSWGQSSGQLAVVVRNQSPRLIQQMRVRITAVDRSNATVLSTTGTARDVCCTIVGLPPGASFGLFAELDRPAWDIAGVRVAPVSTSAGTVRTSPRIVADRAEIQRYADDTVVTAHLTARGGRLSGYVAAQAFLAGRDGRVSQVISGRFYCFGPGRSREVRLHLFHAVPDDLRLIGVVAYPLPAGVRPYVPWKCR